MKKGLLLINLGSPERPTTAAVRRYLRQFLMDRHVVDVAWPVRALLVQGLIAPARAPKSAHAYQTIWSADGSPLLSNSIQFFEGVQQQIPDTIVELGMRYGRPSIRSALEKLRMRGVEDLNVVPLYPQFAKSSTYTAIEEVGNEIRRMKWKVEPRFLQDFYDHPAWVNSLASNIAIENKDFNADFLLLSYHGLPEHHIQNLPKRLCYRTQCFATSQALVQRLNWPTDRYQVSFQSRLGRRPWIKPYSDQVIIELANRGVKRVLVTCPSFVADCLETLEEVAIRLRSDFIAAGGQDLRLVPAVNASPAWIVSFADLLKDQNLTWLNTSEAQSIL